MCFVHVLCQISSCQTFQYVVVAIFKLTAIMFFEIMRKIVQTIINDTFDAHLTHMMSSLSM